MTTTKTDILDKDFLVLKADLVQLLARLQVKAKEEMLSLCQGLYRKVFEECLRISGSTLGEARLRAEIRVRDHLVTVMRMNASAWSDGYISHNNIVEGVLHKVARDLLEPVSLQGYLYQWLKAAELQLNTAEEDASN